MSSTDADIAAALDNPIDAPRFAEPGDTTPDREDGRREREPFPRDCPVTPLGMLSDISGTIKCFYLNALGEIVGLEANNKHGKGSIIALFGRDTWFLEKAWPKWSPPTKARPSEIIGWNSGEVQEALIEECGRRGIFDPAGRMRGRGAHPMANGGIAVHYGDAVLMSQHGLSGKQKDREPYKWFDPGVIDRMVYPASDAYPHPWPHDPGPGDAIKLERLLRTWRWKRGDIDAHLALGGVGQGFIGGAVDWRSHVWITGGAGTGKSTLNGDMGVITKLYDGALFRSGNTTAAGIRSRLRNSTVPVLLDEIEPDAEGHRVKEVIELARIASSGDTIDRGSQNQEAVTFTLRSPVWFSSINIPPMKPQDRSRFAFLELRPFEKDTPEFDDAGFNFAEMGRKLARRMIDGWPRLAETKALYKSALMKAGHTPRAGDQFGQLLACAHVLLEDDLPDDEDCALWAGRLRPARMVEVSESVPDHEACLDHILTTLVQARGGDERQTLVQWIGRAVHASMNTGDPLLGDDGDKVRRQLEQFGLVLVNPVLKDRHVNKEGKDVPAKWGAERMIGGSKVPGYLAVAGSHRALDDIFAGQVWRGGVWRQSLERTPDAIDSVAVKVSRRSTRCVLVPLCAVLEEDELPERWRAELVANWRADAQREIDRQNAVGHEKGAEA